MLQTIRIQNFRSLEDVTLTLQEVNLLIGPNNSGKSNLFKALEFLGKIWKGEIPSEKELKNMFFFKDINTSNHPTSPPISFSIFHKERKSLSFECNYYKLEIHGFYNGNLVANECLGVLKPDYDISIDIDLSNLPSLEKSFDKYLVSNLFNENFDSYIRSNNHKVLSGYKELDEEDVNFLLLKTSKIIINNVKGLGQLFFEKSRGLSSKYFRRVSQILNDSIIYSIDISSLKKPFPTLAEEVLINSDGSNLVAFLDNIRDSYPEIVQKMNTSLRDCISEFETIIFEKVSIEKDDNLRKIFGDKTFKKIGLLDKYGQKYWADELSDGTLYFLALLGIIHQPNPPKLILLEEPENGIHPRRIKEIVDFIFDLAESKGIQVIMTTHSTVLIDEFKDLPESIFVFDKPGESTIIKNLQTDIIADDKKQSEKLNLPEIDLSGSLGDHWASGLIGGVPR